MKRVTYYVGASICCLFAGLALIHLTNGSGTAEEPAKAAETNFGGNLNVGTVLMWWGSRDAVPSGWEICDGEMPKTANAMLPGKKPNLVDRFPKGATPTRKTITDLSQATGGTNNMPALRINKIEGLKIVEDGAHTHAPLAQKTAVSSTDFSSGNKDSGKAKDSSKVIQAQDSSDSSSRDSNEIVQARGTSKTKPVATAAGNDESASEGKHSHDIKGFIGSENGISADGDDKSGANQPAYSELFFIIRVK